MSLSTALSNALSGLTAASRETEVIANNIANAQTPGYTRRVAELSAATVGSAGAGVTVAGIQLIQDPVAIANRRRVDAELGMEATALGTLTRLSDLVGVPGDGAALADAANALEIALSAAASDPAAEPRLAAVASAASRYAGELNTLSTETQRLRMEADAEIGRQVELVNQNLSSIEFINREIKMVTLAGGDATALVDQRKGLIDQITSILPIRAVNRDNGDVALFTANGAQLLDPAAVTLGFSPTPTIMQDMTLAGGALSGLTVDGRPLSVGAGDGSGLADGGSLGQLFVDRDTVLPEVADQLDLLAEDLVSRFQAASIDGTRAPGDPGLFTDDGAAYAPADREGISARIVLNAAADPAQGGELYRIRDGLGAAGPGIAGDARLLTDLIGAATRDLTPPAGLGFAASGGIADFAESFSSLVASRQYQAEKVVSYTRAANLSLQEDELAVSGVNTDAELQRLLQVEKAYAANALVLSTVDDLLRQLLEI